MTSSRFTCQALDVDDVDGESVELDPDFRFIPDVEDTSREYLQSLYYCPSSASPIYLPHMDRAVRKRNIKALYLLIFIDAVVI